MAYVVQNVSHQSMDISKLFGLTEAQEEINEQEPKLLEEPSFLPYRVFINNVDTYFGRECAGFLSDQQFGAKKPNGKEGAEEEDYDVILEDEQEMGKKGAIGQELGHLHNYEIIGTVQDPNFKMSEDVKEIIKDPSEREYFTKKLLSCGFIIFDITSDPAQISEAQWALKVVEEYLVNIKKSTPKAFKKLEEVRVFILISTVLTWAMTRPIDPEEPDSPFIENDYRKRKPHANFKEHVAFEKELLRTGRQHASKLKTMVIASGVMYGGKQDVLHFFFKAAWHNEPSLPIFGPGTNFVPLIHVKDLVNIIHNIMEEFPTRIRYLIAVEFPVSTLGQITRAISKSLGSGKTHNIVLEEVFLFPEINQQMYDMLTVNLNMEPVFVVEMNWLSEGNFVDNMQQVVQEYREARGLYPIKIFVHGPPAVGKTVLSKKLCEYYKLHHLTIENVIEEAIRKLKERLEEAAAKEGEKEIEEEVGEVDEDEVQEMKELLETVQASIDVTGRPDEDHVLRFFKERLDSNPCQNQGYVLDGFPYLLTQAQNLFQPTEEQEMDPEDDNVQITFNKKTMPEFAISLEASDEFLWERVIDMPEKDLQASPYAEEKMVISLSEFRKDNTEELTVMNFFDEAEVHCMIYDISKDESEFLEDTLHDIVAKIGKPRNYGPSAEEIKQMEKVEKERLRKRQLEIEQEEQNIRKQILEEQVTKMEEWATFLNMLKEEEAAVLAVQGVPMREFLMKNVFPVLTRGLIEVARTRPTDPIDFLAEFLFKENPEGKMFQPEFLKRN